MGYLIRHFKPLKAKPVNAFKAYLVALLKHPQRWRLEALFDDGELDGEVCETVLINETGAVVGCQRHSAEDSGVGANGEMLIELEVNASLGEREAARIYGDVRAQHCRLLRMGNDFYVWALESHIGTVSDGHKYREHDGPVPVRDGSVLGVGKYLLYCEVGTAVSLQQRRAKLVDGYKFWQEGEDCVKTAEVDAADDADDAMVDEIDPTLEVHASESAADPNAVAEVRDTDTDVATGSGDNPAAEPPRIDSETEASNAKRKKDAAEIEKEAEEFDKVEGSAAADDPDMESMSLLDRLAAEYELEAAAAPTKTAEVAESGGKKNKNKKRKK